MKKVSQQSQISISNCTEHLLFKLHNVPLVSSYSQLCWSRIGIYHHRIQDTCSFWHLTFCTDNLCTLSLHINNFCREICVIYMSLYILLKKSDRYTFDKCGPRGLEENLHDIPFTSERFLLHVQNSFSDY